MTQADPGGEDGSVLEFKLRFAENEYMLMEGALGTRLKAEYGLEFDEAVAMAGLVYQENAREALGRLWGEYYQVAAAAGWPFLATTPTRRANRERVRASRFSPERIIGDNVDFLKEVRLSCQEGPRAGAFAPPMYIGGLMGCRGDAYRADQALTPEEGEYFHRWQAERFAGAGMDFLYAGIMPALPEAIGMAKAMAGTGLPYLISFMVRRDGRLPDGTPVSAAVREIDRQTGSAGMPLCYMSNCVYPGILAAALAAPENRTPWLYQRFRGIQANASALSPEELEASAGPLAAEPDEWAAEVAKLRRLMRLTIVGGCCGTNAGHLASVVRALSRPENQALRETDSLNYRRRK